MDWQDVEIDWKALSLTVVNCGIFAAAMAFYPADLRLVQLLRDRFTRPDAPVAVKPPKDTPSAPPSPSPALVPSAAPYHRLESLLAARNFVAADEENGRILYENMYDVHLYRKQIDCRVLCAIDARWKKYSGNRFGFSVQRRIYDQVIIADVQQGNGHPANGKREDALLKALEVDPDSLQGRLLGGGLDDSRAPCLARNRNSPSR
jgi:hypothetical protein